MPFRSELRNGVLHLSLETPGSEINIFNQDAASSLQNCLASLDFSVRAVVVHSAKPLSFLNGAQLMAANMIRSAEDAVRLAKGTADAYASLANCPVPTIAAVRGNCYGCGVEFILNCDFRIAADTFATHFYMTELSDYLLIPFFGSTQRLPGLIGLDKASEFILWG
jgi:enoyl-CoA hydratase/carnithine racemase